MVAVLRFAVVLRKISLYIIVVYIEDGFLSSNVFVMCIQFYSV
jgi:hypothetical protein